MCKIYCAEKRNSSFSADKADGAWENTAFTFGRAGLLGTHVKNHPVHFFNDGAVGTLARAIETPFGKIGTPICFDNDYQDVVRRMTRDGAALFLVPSMDAAHWTAREHEQHAMLFRHRAAENGRWMAVAATSGVTQIIDSHGQVRARLPVMREGILRGRLLAESGKTFFQRGGWFFGPLCLGLSVLLAAIISVADFRRRDR